MHWGILKWIPQKQRSIISEHWRMTLDSIVLRDTFENVFHHFYKCHLRRILAFPQQVSTQHIVITNDDTVNTWRTKLNTMSNDFHLPKWIYQPFPFFFFLIFSRICYCFVCICCFLIFKIYTFPPRMLINFGVFHCLTFKN